MSPTFDIHAAIPHRGPMLLIDEVASLHSDRIVCRKTVKDDEFFLQGHYPNQPVVPGVILCECAMQAGAILLAQQIQGASGIPVATRLNNVKFKRMVRPGETIEIEASLQERLGDAYFLKARVTCQGTLAARLDFACTLVDGMPEEEP